MTQNIHNEATLSARPGSVEIKTDHGSRILITPACAAGARPNILLATPPLAEGRPLDVPSFLDHRYRARNARLQ